MAVMFQWFVAWKTRERGSLDSRGSEVRVPRRSGRFTVWVLIYHLQSLLLDLKPTPQSRSSSPALGTSLPPTPMQGLSDCSYPCPTHELVFPIHEEACKFAYRS